MRWFSEIIIDAAFLFEEHQFKQLGFPRSSVGKESACNAGDLGLISGLGRSPGEGNGYPIQYSCLENPMDRGAWWVTVHGVTRVRHDLVTKETNLDLRTLKPTGNWCLVRTNLGVDACYSFSDSFLSPTGVFLFPFIYFLIYVFICALSEKAMAPHSSTLAWKIPWTEEPGRLQSMGLLRVGHDWVASLSLFTFMHWRRKWQPTPEFLPGESQGRGSLVGCRLWGRTESDTTEAT